MGGVRDTGIRSRKKSISLFFRNLRYIQAMADFVAPVSEAEAADVVVAAPAAAASAAPVEGA